VTMAKVKAAKLKVGDEVDVPTRSHGAILLGRHTLICREGKVKWSAKHHRTGRTFVLYEDEFVPILAGKETERISTSACTCGHSVEEHSGHRGCSECDCIAYECDR
jgi:hypothetical protein